MEAVRLRVKDLDLAQYEIVVRDGKGGKTDSNNCELLCKTYNRAKGNK
jgi:hypothetical protein